MKPFLPHVPIIMDEVCDRHQRNMEHTIQFRCYHAMTHKVSFRYFCTECFAELGERYCLQHHVVIMADDWIEMTALVVDWVADN